MNPYLLLGIGLVWLASLGTAGYLGNEYAEGQYAKEKAKEKAMIDQVREANREFADTVALETAEAIKKIRVQNRTINNEVRHEREIHHVLNDAACAVPVTTVRVLNRARMDSQGQSPSGPTSTVPAARPATGGSPSVDGRPSAGGLGSGISVPGVRETR